MPKTRTHAEAILEGLRDNPATREIIVYKIAPDVTTGAGGTECDDGGYAAFPIDSSAAFTEAPSANPTRQELRNAGAAVTFGSTSGYSAQALGIRVISGGAIEYWKLISPPKAVGAGETLRVDTNNFKIQES